MQDLAKVLSFSITQKYIIKCFHIGISFYAVIIALIPVFLYLNGVYHVDLIGMNGAQLPIVE